MKKKSIFGKPLINWPKKVDHYRSLGTRLNAGVKIFGGWSRAHEQRSLAIFARKKYGTKKIEYPFFPDRPYSEFHSVILRNSGNDWNSTMLRDVAMTSLMDGSGLETQDYRQVAVYLNGEYWGMYNLREKVNEHFLASKYDIEKDDIDLLEANAVVVEGVNTDFTEMTAFLEDNSLVTDENYQMVVDKIDIDNFIIYQIAQIYFNNIDWPHNNIKYWKSPSTKWRWILYDTDFGFGNYSDEDYLTDTLRHATATDNHQWATLLLRRLLENAEFRQLFINRFTDELNSRFLADKVLPHIDTLADVIATEMPMHYDRWVPVREPGQDEDDEPDTWEDKITLMKSFAELRTAEVRKHIVNAFDLAGTYTLTLNNMTVEAGHVQVNRLTIGQANWRGDYFSGLPISITAVAKPGFEFSHWLDIEANPIAGETLQRDPVENLTLTPVFVQIIATVTVVSEGSTAK